jgi:hypothetical protein
MTVAKLSSNGPMTVANDTVAYVVTDLLERLRFPELPTPALTLGGDPDEPGTADTTALDTLDGERQRTRFRIAGVAQRLAEAGDVEDASRIDGQVDALSTGDMRTYGPVLRPLVIEKSEYETEMILRNLGWLRREFGWLVDQLRPDDTVAPALNEYSEAVARYGIDPTAYRWGRIIDADVDTSAAWDQRFTHDSWLRLIFEKAATELPVMMGAQTMAGMGTPPRPEHSE